MKYPQAILIAISLSSCAVLGADGLAFNPTNRINPYIVTCRKDVDQSRLAADFNHLRTHVWQNALNGYATCLDTEVAKRLKADPRVVAVEFDTQMELHYENWIPPGAQRLGLADFPEVHIDGHNHQINVNVAVLDTGIQTNHPALNVVGNISFVPCATPGLDCQGHGTSVAGILGAMDNQSGYLIGVAPGVRLWSVQVLCPCDNAWSRFLDGLNWVVQNSNTIQVANASLGSYPYGPPPPFEAVHQAIIAVVNAGIVFVCSSGNAGVDIFGLDGVYDSPAGAPDDVIPAAYPESMTVSVMNTDGVNDGNDSIIGYSNYSDTRAPSAVVFSPGNGIDVAGPLGQYTTYPTYIRATGSGWTYSFGGTSSAAPHVSGLVALYIAANGRAHNAQDVYRIRQAIVNSAQPQSAWNNPSSANPSAGPGGGLEPLAMPSESWIPAPAFTRATISAQGFESSFTTVPGYQYTAQSASSLNTSNTWTFLATTNGTGSPATVLDSNPNGLSGFYRALRRPALPLTGPYLQVATNLGSLGAAANGAYVGATPGVPGVIAGQPASTAARFPNDFPGTVDVETSLPVNPSGPFSIELWAKPSQTTNAAFPASMTGYDPIPGHAAIYYGGWKMIQGNYDLSNGNGFTFSLYTIYTASGYKYHTDASIMFPLSSNAWYHLVGVCDGTNLQLYLNGVNAASAAVTSGFTPNANSFTTIGALDDFTSYYSGDLGEVAIYTNALTATQALSHYQAGTNASPVTPYQQVILSDKPIAYWRFSEH
jgi:hypothetical protein